MCRCILSFPLFARCCGCGCGCGCALLCTVFFVKMNVRTWRNKKKFNLFAHHNLRLLVRLFISFPSVLYDPPRPCPALCKKVFSLFFFNTFFVTFFSDPEYLPAPSFLSPSWPLPYLAPAAVARPPPPAATRPTQPRA